MIYMHLDRFMLNDESNATPVKENQWQKNYFIIS